MEPRVGQKGQDRPVGGQRAVEGGVVPLDPGVGDGGQRDLPGGQVLDEDVVDPIGVARVEVGGVAAEGHDAAVRRQPRGEGVAVAVVLDPCIRRRGQGDVAAGQLLDVDVVAAVAVGRIEVGRRGGEGYRAAVRRERRRETGVGVALDVGVRGGRQRDLPAGQVLDVDIASAVGVGRVEVRGGGQKRHSAPVGRHHRIETGTVARHARVGRRGEGDVSGAQILDVDVGIRQWVGVSRVEVAGL